MTEVTTLSLHIHNELSDKLINYTCVRGMKVQRGTKRRTTDLARRYNGRKRKFGEESLAEEVGNTSKLTRRCFAGKRKDFTVW